MSDTSTAPDDTAPAPGAEDQTERLPWTAAMLACTEFTPVGRGGKFFDPAEVLAFKARVVARVAQLERDYSSTYEQLTQIQEANRRRHDPRGGPPTMAVDAVVRAGDQAESALATARREYHLMRFRTARLRDEAETMRREAEEYLRAAKAGAPMPVRELPPEPQFPSDPEAMPAYVAALSEHLSECRRLLDGWHAEDQARRGADDARRAELNDKLAGFVTTLDGLAAVVPDARARLDGAPPAAGHEAKAAS